MSYPSVLALGVGLALALPSPVSAVTITRADGTTVIKRYQRMVDKAPVPTRSGVVRIVYGQTATEYNDDRVIHVERGEPLSDATFWHELGHDWQKTLTDRAFDTWRAWAGVRQTRYQVSPYDVPELGYHSTRFFAQEYMADWYAGCATRGASTEQVSWSHPDLWRGSYDGWAVDHRVWRESCRRIYRLPRGD